MSSRLLGVDLARTLAILAMVATHTLPLRDPSTDDPTLVGLLFAGRSSVLFAVLAGSALVLMSHKSLLYLWTRSAILVLLGFLLEQMGTPVLIILGPLGVAMAVVAPLRRVRWKPLSAIALLWLAAAPWLQFLLGKTALGSVQLPMAWDGYPVLIWSAYAVCGAAVMAWFLQTQAFAQLKKLWLLAVVSFAGAAAFWVAGYNAVLSVTREEWVPRLMVGVYPRWLPFQPFPYPMEELEQYPFLLTPHSSAPFAVYQHALVAVGLMAALIGVGILLDRFRKSLPVSAVAGVGRWSLTTYSAHLVALALVSAGEALGSVDTATKAFFVFAVVMSLGLVSTRGGRGPLEWAVSRAATVVADKWSTPDASSSGPGHDHRRHRS